MPAATGLWRGFRRRSASQLRPGTLVCPDDFVALDAEPLTTLEGVAAHRVPHFDAALRGELTEALREAEIEVVEDGVYWQARGPRLETPAEIRFIARTPT